MKKVLIFKTRYNMPDNRIEILKDKIQKEVGESYIVLVINGEQVAFEGIV